MVICDLLGRHPAAGRGADPRHWHDARLGCPPLDRFGVLPISTFRIRKAGLHPGTGSLRKPAGGRVALDPNFWPSVWPDVAAVFADHERTGFGLGAGSAADGFD